MSKKKLSTIDELGRYDIIWQSWPDYDDDQADCEWNVATDCIGEYGRPSQYSPMAMAQGMHMAIAITQIPAMIEIIQALVRGTFEAECGEGESILEVAKKVHGVLSKRYTPKTWMADQKKKVEAWS